MTKYYQGRSVDDEYFRDRSEQPYRSTVALCAFGEASGFFDLSDGAVVLDLACGTGSETAWLARRYPDLSFRGLDISEKFIAAARARYGEIPNLGFDVGDIYSIQDSEAWQQAEVIWFSQTLSWLPWRDPALLSIAAPHVRAILMSTLAWPSEIESEVIHHLGDRSDSETASVNYNVYSIPRMTREMAALGFRTSSTEFEIDIDLERPDHDGFGSYTVRTNDGHRMLFSIWQALPWHFFAFTR